MEAKAERADVPAQGTTLVHHPGYTTPGTYLYAPAPVRPWSTRSAMGSKWTLRNSGLWTQVNLSETICLLAPVLGPCCKNHLYPMAPGYLGLSIPPQILSSLVTLP